MKTTIEIKEWISKNGTGKKVKYSELHNDSSSDEIVTLVDFDAEEFEKWFNSKEPEYIDIPEGIRFVTSNLLKNLLGLIFNEGKQILSFYNKEKVFQVFSYAYNINNGYIEEIPCKLIECKYEDLVVGDIYVGIGKQQYQRDVIEKLSNYCIYLDIYEYACIGQDKNIITQKYKINNDTHFYKVVKK